jgi:transposase
MTVKTLGIDLGKSVFHVVGLDTVGRVSVTRRLSRTQLVHWLGNVLACLIGMEACPGRTT